MMRSITIIILLGISLLAFAQKNAVPSCNPLPVRGQSVLLSSKKPVMIMIHNLSEADLWITHPVSDPGASAGGTSSLTAGKWSALVVNKESYALNCIESKPGHEQQIPCEGMLAVCKWSAVKIKSQQGGTYWAGENMNWSDLTTYLGGRGFSLPSLR